MNCNKNQLTVATYPRAELVLALPEIGGGLISQAKRIDDKVDRLMELAKEIFNDDNDLRVEISNLWTHEEITQSLGTKFEQMK